MIRLLPGSGKVKNSDDRSFRVEVYGQIEEWQISSQALQTLGGHWDGSAFETAAGRIESIVQRKVANGSSGLRLIGMDDV